MQSFSKGLRALSVDLKDFYEPLLNGKSKVQKIWYHIVVRKNMENMLICVLTIICTWVNRCTWKYACKKIYQVVNMGSWGKGWHSG